MRARKLLLAVAVTGILTLGGQTPATTNTGQKNWKDRAEYDLYDAIKNDASPQTKLEKLKVWQDKYPTTEFIDLRQGAFLTTYAALGQVQKALDIAKEILARDPIDFSALYYTAFLTPQLVALNLKPTDDQLAAAEKAATAILTASKPANLTDDQWKTAKTSAEAVAHKTLGWVAMQRKQPEQAEDEFKKALALNPADTEVSYWLGIVILLEHKADKQVEALYDYARAAAFDGPGATLTAAGRDAVKQQLSGLYTRYHGSTEGLDQLLQQAKANPNFSEGTKIRSAKEVEDENAKKREAEDAAHPDILLWKNIKAALTAPDGATYFGSGMKGTMLPGGANGVQKFTGTVISMSPATRPKTVVIGIENPSVPDATLRFEAPLAGKVEPGTKISFSGTAESYTTNPFMVVFSVERKNLEGWTGVNTAPRRTPARKRPAR